MAGKTMSMGDNSTIKSYIEDYDNEDLTYKKLYKSEAFLSEEKKCIVNFDSLLVKYFPEFTNLKIKHELTNEEYLSYRYNPKRMSFDLYGTTELWFLLLEANELSSITQFDLHTVWVYQANITDLITKIIGLEEDIRNFNAEYLKSRLLELAKD